MRNPNNKKAAALLAQNDGKTQKQSMSIVHRRRAKCKRRLLLRWALCWALRTAGLWKLVCFLAFAGDHPFWSLGSLAMTALLMLAAEELEVRVCVAS